MSKALRTVAVIAGSVALIATGAGAAFGAAGIAGVASAGTISTIATVASIAAGVASFGAQITAPKPIARGSPAQVILDVEPPRPYIVGRVMTGGVIRYDNAYGPTIKKVPNPYRWQVRVLSGVGPIQGIVGGYFDFQPIGGFYSGFFGTSQNLGSRPQASALVPPFGAAPGWTSASRLSGCAHIGLNFLFDRDGERFASGIPVYTALCDGEKVYDPRQDSTFPGGSGSCRAGVESTYVYNANPACHALTYALGRFQNGKRIFGLGVSVDAIDLPAIVDWANDCDANAWTANLILTEGGRGANLREQRVRNLDDLCAAGGGRWFQAGGLLSFDWHRPRLSLATLTDEDILEAGGGTDAVQTVRDRMNGVRPQYVDPASNYQQITADEIIGTTYRTEDGTPLTQVYPLNGVTNAAQAGELASYAMADSREIGPMDLQATADWRFYRPGDCITVDSSLVAYEGQAVIMQRGLNPQTFAVPLSLKSETPGKHDFALGKVADPPPTPVLAQTAEEKDLLASAALAPRGDDVADVIAPANANRVPFSRFERPDTWYVSAISGVTGSALSFALSGGYQTLTYTATAAGGGNFGSFKSAIFPLRGGERLSCQARMSTNIRSECRVTIRYFDGSGTPIAAQPEVMPFAGIGTPPQFLFQGFTTAPSNAVSGELEVFVPATGAGDLSASFSEPMITSAAAGQTVHPAFSPGPNSDDGADITATVTGPAEIVLDYTSTDVLVTALPETGNFVLAQAGIGPLSSGVSWAVSVIAGAFVGAAPTIVGSGGAELRVNSGLSTSEATLRVLATYAGRTYPPLDIKVRKNVLPPATSGGGGSPTANIVSDNTLTSVGTSGAFASVSDDLTITLPSGVTEVTLTAASLTLRVASTLPEGATNSEFKWQRESSPGVWSDVGGIASSSPSPTVTDSPEFGIRNIAGSVTCNRTASGLTAASTQKFRFVGRFVSGNSKTTTVGGTVSAQT